MKNTHAKTLDWAFWFYWIMATTVGWILGSFLFSGIPVVVAGVAVAALQWAVLYKRIPNAWRWFLASSLGWITGYVLFAIFFAMHMGFLLGPVVGVAVGVAQWFLLRQQVDWSGWWIVFSALGWTTGLALVPGLLTTGALPGALTGLALVILFRFSSPKQKNQERTK